MHDPFAVSVIKDDKTTVGHVPRGISKEMTNLLSSGGKISVIVTDHPVSMKREGMRVPCQYIVHGSAESVYEIKRAVKEVQ